MQSSNKNLLKNTEIVIKKAVKFEINSVSTILLKINKIIFYYFNFNYICVSIKKNNKMAKIKGAVVINVERCKGCNLCVVSCPSNVLALNKEANSKGYNYSIMADPDSCVGCSACALVCPDACITVYRVRV